MQDDNTAQSNDDNAGVSTVTGGNVIEPDLGLGTNPSDQPATDTGIAGDDSTIQPQSDDDNTVINDQPIEPSEPDASTEENAEPEGVEAEDSMAVPAPSGDLESIKSSALQELAPIISELDQEPEEKYQTLMMMIQASDDQSLIKDAYEAADAIGDKKVKAEALLTIVNEINYLTGKDKTQPEA